MFYVVATSIGLFSNPSALALIELAFELGEEGVRWENIHPVRVFGWENARRIELRR
jgi:hypothetical protein